MSTLIIESRDQIEVDRASQHYNGLGMQGGVDWFATLRHFKKYKEKDDEPVEEVEQIKVTPLSSQEFGALQSILSGATWPGTRVQSMDSEISSQCSRCGEEYEDDLHTFWK